MIDEDGSPTFDHTAHAAVDGADLDNTLDHLDGAPLLVDDDSEGRSLDDRSQHRRVDGEMGDAGVLHLEQQSSEVLNDAGEAGRLRGRGEPKFAPRSNENVIASAHECGPTSSAGQQGIAGRELAIHLDGGRLQPGMHDLRIAAQLGHHPFVRSCSARWSADHEKKRDEHQSEFVHCSHSIALIRGLTDFG
jgi:hypothetical protein